MTITGAVLEEVGRPGPWAETTPLTVGELELEGPHAGEVLVQVEAAGVCHSDLSVVDGNRPRPVPMLLGHEACGRVTELGAGVTDLQVGQRVVMTFLPRCGDCAGCATDGRMPCGPGSASNNAGEMLGGVASNGADASCDTGNGTRVSPTGLRPTSVAPGTAVIALGKSRWA